AARPEGDESVHVSLLRESGRLHLRMQQYAEAERELDQAFSLSRRVLGEDKGIVWYTGSEWGRALAGEGRLAEAEAIQRQAAARLASLIGPEAYHNCLVEEALADTLEQRGGAGAEVVRLRRHAVALTERKYPRTSPLWAERDGARSDLRAALQKFATQALPDATALARAQALQREVGGA